MKFDVELILSNKCSFNCSHCYAIRNNDTMTDDILNESIKFISEKAISNPDTTCKVRIIGGEIWN